jgi:HlyD family secretion protein
MLTLMGLACFGITWASLAKIEQVVPATGQLKPEGTVKEIQAPVGGVVKEVYIKDGQKVEAGDSLLIFDSTATNAELNSLQKVRIALMQENKIYRQLMQIKSTTDESEYLNLNISKEAASLLKNRAALSREKELLLKELKNFDNATGLELEERARLQVAKRELDSRTTVAQLEVEQIRKKLAQNKVQISDTQDSLAIEEGILNKLTILAQEGGISQLQYLQQQRKVQSLKAQAAQLLEEQQSLQFNITQGQQELKNTIAVSQKNILEKIADNKRRIADLESQFTRIILDNEKQLANINSKISQIQLNLKYQRLRAPVSGTIFDLQQAGNPGFVAQSSQKLLSIVPNDKYIAEAFVTNKDIGFVREGMKVDVRIDSFPFSEFGGIEGEIIEVASDALPPEQAYPYYRFPIKISLNRQSLNVKGRDISLQSGMSITANIKVREERRVISLLTELFTKQVETLKEVR